MKKLLSFIVVTTFTTLTLTAQESAEQPSFNEKGSNSEATSIHKVNASDEIRGNVITDLNKNKAMDPAITLYPNPSSDLLNISFNSDSQSTVKIEILDVLGKKVLEENFNAQIGNNVHTIFISRFKNGLYYVNFNGSAQRFTKN